MPRKPRFVVAGVPQHVIQRGHNREPCFYAAEDYQRYLDELKQAIETNGARLHAYVLMTNHVHLLVTPLSENSISHFMQDLGRKYVKYINATYPKPGSDTSFSFGTLCFKGGIGGGASGGAQACIARTKCS